VIFEVVTRLLFHTMIVLAVFLLFSGHNAPGGGFAAGLVAGLALTVRYLAGGRYELGEAAPVQPGVLLGTGLFLSVGVGLVPLALGGDMLQSAVVEASLGPLGDVKLVTTLFFDIGVFLVVLGLVLDVLRALGAEVDRQGEAEGRAVPEVAFDSPVIAADDTAPDLAAVRLAEGPTAGGAT
jgi:multicomponent Na+:H+ antiporter subunit A